MQRRTQGAELCKGSTVVTELPTPCQVFTRVRPPLERERRGYLPYADAVLVHPDARTISLSENACGSSLDGSASVENGLACTALAERLERS